MRERTRYDGYTYVWHQAAYNPITGEGQCHIDFEFDDGSVLKQAFSYEYRLGRCPKSAKSYWRPVFAARPSIGRVPMQRRGANGDFTPTEIGEPDAGWIAYLVAEN